MEPPEETVAVINRAEWRAIRSGFIHPSLGERTLSSQTSESRFDTASRHQSMNRDLEVPVRSETPQPDPITLGRGDGATERDANLPDVVPFVSVEDIPHALLTMGQSRTQ